MSTYLIRSGSSGVARPQMARARILSQESASFIARAEPSMRGGGSECGVSELRMNIAAIGSGISSLNILISEVDQSCG